jgi:hypothetical protein
VGLWGSLLYGNVSHLDLQYLPTDEYYGWRGQFKSMNSTPLRYEDLGIKNYFCTPEVKLKIANALKKCILAFKNIHHFKKFLCKDYGS